MTARRTMPKKENDLSEEQIWSFVREMGECERHFNLLQARYRVLASTWLLAAFGAIGFIISKEFTVVINKWLLISGVGLAGTIGIILLWVMDLLVYHNLLNACYTEAYKLEERYSWLPQVRHNMMIVQGHRGVRYRVVRFYMISALILFIIAGSSCLYYSICFPLVVTICGAALFGGIGWFLLWSMWTKTVESATLISSDECE